MANKKAEILTMEGQVVSPITLATNVLLEDGRTAQDLLDSRDESMFSPTITTSSSISKVGQGDNVDFSENIIDGAYKSCVLKGKTLVNYNAEGNDRDEYVCMPSLEGNNLTVNGTVEGKVKSAILKGQTLVNIAYIKQGLYNYTDYNLSFIDKTKTYFIKFNATFETNQIGFIVDNNEWNIYKIFTNPTTNGYVKIKPDESKEISAIRIRFNGNTDTSFIPTLDLICIEYQDGMENWDIPFFTGMESVKMPVLTTTGNNLWNGKWYKGFSNTGGGGELATLDDLRTAYRTDYIKIPKNTDKVYAHRFCEATNYTGTNVHFGFFDKNKQLLFVEGGLSPASWSVPTNAEYVVVHVWNSVPYDFTTLRVNVSTAPVNVTSYEPYKSNILTTTGKNLFDMNRPYDAITDSQATVVQDTNQITVSSAESGTYVNANFILDKDFFAGKTVTGSCLYESDEKDIGTVQIVYQDGNGEHHYQWIKTPRTFTFPNSFIGDVMLSISANNTDTPQSNTVTVKNIQLELGSTATSYEPYSEVVLRGIGDVQDTLDCLTGELTERIGEVVLDGSENWNTFQTPSSSPNHAFAQLSMPQLKTGGVLSENFPCHTRDLWGTELEGFYVNAHNMLQFNVQKSKLSEVSLNGLKNYIRDNSFVLSCVLNENVVKTVVLSITDQDGQPTKLSTFNDTTHFTCSSEDGSLIPTLTIEEGVKYQAIIKPSTKYSIVFNRTEVASGLTVDLGGATANITSTTLGKNIVQIATLPTLSHNYVIFKGLGNVIKDVQVIEGDVADDIEYFEGMVDVKNPIVINCNSPIIFGKGGRL